MPTILYNDLHKITLDFGDGIDKATILINTAKDEYKCLAFMMASCPIKKSDVYGYEPQNLPPKHLRTSNLDYVIVEEQTVNDKNCLFVECSILPFSSDKPSQIQSKVDTATPILLQILQKVPKRYVIAVPNISLYTKLADSLRSFLQCFPKAQPQSVLLLLTQEQLNEAGIPQSLNDIRQIMSKNGVSKQICDFLGACVRDGRIAYLQDPMNPPRTALNKISFEADSSYDLRLSSFFGKSESRYSNLLDAYNQFITQFANDMNHYVFKLWKQIADILDNLSKSPNTPTTDLLTYLEVYTQVCEIVKQNYQGNQMGKETYSVISKTCSTILTDVYPRIPKLYDQEGQRKLQFYRKFNQIITICCDQDYTLSNRDDNKKGSWFDGDARIFQEAACLRRTINFFKEFQLPKPKSQTRRNATKNASGESCGQNKTQDIFYLKKYLHYLTSVFQKQPAVKNTLGGRYCEAKVRLILLNFHSELEILRQLTQIYLDDTLSMSDKYEVIFELAKILARNGLFKESLRFFDSISCLEQMLRIYDRLMILNLQGIYSLQSWQDILIQKAKCLASYGLQEKAKETLMKVWSSSRCMSNLRSRLVNEIESLININPKQSMLAIKSLQIDWKNIEKCMADSVENKERTVLTNGEEFLDRLNIQFRSLFIVNSATY